MLGGPIQNKVWSVDPYINSIFALDYPKELISLVWLVNDSIDGTREKLIERLKPIKKSGVYRRVSVVEINHGFQDVRRDRSAPEFRVQRSSDPAKDITNFVHFARVRNDWLKLRTHRLALVDKKVEVVDELALGDEEYYFSIDSDIVLINPLTLRTLVYHNLDAVAVPVDNAENRLDGYNPQEEVMEKLIIDPDSVNADFLQNVKNGTIKSVRVGSKHAWNFGMIRGGSFRRFEPYASVFEVDATGACILFKRDLVESGVIYGPHPGGEDYYFCALAKSLGFKFYIDGSFRTCHMMDCNPFEIEEIKEST
jgi:hypothetical protein